MACVPRGRDIRLARIQNSAVSEHTTETGHVSVWYKVKVIDHDPHWNTLWMKEAIHRRPHSNKVDRGSVVETEAWMPTIKMLQTAKL